MRPWSIWWSFKWDDHDIRWITIRTDHPDYSYADYIYIIPIELCEDESGHIDKWIETWFNNFRDDYISNKKSFQELMTGLGFKKGKKGKKKNE